MKLYKLIISTWEETDSHLFKVLHETILSCIQSLLPCAAGSVAFKLWLFPSALHDNVLIKSLSQIL